ncbi:MAG: hypothetical protein Q9217_006812, partial [Psora testacea]
MSNERCSMYNNNGIERPIDTLNCALEETKAQRSSLPVNKAVVHWFKRDLRVSDNKALCLASEKAKSKGVPLICLYVVSPQDFKAQMTAPARVDFILRSLEIVREALVQTDVQLHVETVDERKRIMLTPSLSQIADRILDLCKDWSASHLFTNIKYEVDELRREASIIRRGMQNGIAVDVVPDT